MVVVLPGKSVLLCEYTLVLVLVSEVAHASSHLILAPIVRHVDVHPDGLVGSKDITSSCLLQQGIPQVCSPDGE